MNDLPIKQNIIAAEFIHKSLNKKQPTEHKKSTFQFYYTSKEINIKKSSIKNNLTNQLYKIYFYPSSESNVTREKFKIASIEILVTGLYEIKRIEITTDNELFQSNDWINQKKYSPTVNRNTREKTIAFDVETISNAEHSEFFLMELLIKINYYHKIPVGLRKNLQIALGIEDHNLHYDLCLNNSERHLFFSGYIKEIEKILGKNKTICKDIQNLTKSFLNLH